MFAGSSEAFSGTFTVILFDSAASDYCAVDWTFDADSTEADEDYTMVWFQTASVVLT